MSGCKPSSPGGKLYLSLLLLYDQLRISERGVPQRNGMEVGGSNVKSLKHSDLTAQEVAEEGLGSGSESVVTLTTASKANCPTFISFAHFCHRSLILGFQHSDEVVMNGLSEYL